MEFDMDPALLMILFSALTTGVGAATGSPGQQKSTFSKGQRGALDDILQSIKSMKNNAQDITQNQNYQTGQDWLQSMFSDPSFFDKFEAPIKRQYEEQIVPDLANRFASMGSGGSTGSTGFRNQANREGSNLATNLAALRGGMQQQAIPQLLGYAQQPFQNLMSLQNLALGQGTMNQYQPPSTGGIGSLAAPFAQAGATAYANRPFPGQSPTTV